jgi:hypothetical protein
MAAFLAYPPRLCTIAGSDSCISTDAFPLALGAIALLAYGLLGHSMSVVISLLLANVLYPVEIIALSLYSASESSVSHYSLHSCQLFHLLLFLAHDCQALGTFTTCTSSFFHFFLLSFINILSTNDLSTSDRVLSTAAR